MLWLPEPRDWRAGDRCRSSDWERTEGRRELQQRLQEHFVWEQTQRGSQGLLDHEALGSRVRGEALQMWREKGMPVGGNKHRPLGTRVQEKSAGKWIHSTSTPQNLDIFISNVILYCLLTLVLFIQWSLAYVTLMVCVCLVLFVSALQYHALQIIGTE